MINDLDIASKRQLNQVLRKIVTDEQFDVYSTKMLNLEQSQAILLEFFRNLCKRFSISDDKISSYCFIVEHITDKKINKNSNIQSEAEIKEKIHDENIRKQKEKIDLDEEMNQLYENYKQVKEERDKILQELKLNESVWNKLPHKIDKKKFRLYSDLLYVVEDLQRSINNV